MVAVRRRGRSDHEDQLGFLGEASHRVLAVLGRVTNVVSLRQLDSREAPAQSVEDLSGIVHRERGLGHAGETFWVLDHEIFDVGDRFAILPTLDLDLKAGDNRAAFGVRVAYSF